MNSCELVLFKAVVRFCLVVYGFRKKCCFYTGKTRALCTCSIHYVVQRIVGDVITKLVHWIVICRMIAYNSELWPHTHFTENCDWYSLKKFFFRCQADLLFYFYTAAKNKEITAWVMTMTVQCLLEWHKDIHQQCLILRECKTSSKKRLHYILTF